MDTKGFEKKPWFPYLKNMYDEIGEDMIEVDAKGYEEKPWWPYVLDLQEKIDAGGGGGGLSLPGRVNISKSGRAGGSIAIPGVWMEKQALSPSATEEGPFAGEMKVPMDFFFKSYALAVPTLDVNGSKYIMGAFKFIPRGSTQGNIYVDGVTATGGTIVYDAEHYVVSYRTNPGTTEMTITFTVHGGTT